MFDPQKLSEYLDRLVPTFGQALAQSSVPLSEKLDKYDLEKQNDYKNLGTKEFPIYGKPAFPSYIDLATAAYSYSYQYMSPQNVYWSMGVNGVDSTPAPVEDTHGKLKDKISLLGNAEPVKVRKPSPDYCHTMTTWRGWQVSDGKLSALGTDHDWEPRKIVKADCNHNSHSAPQMNCQCGFWSFKSLDLLTEALRSYSTSVQVIGTVEIWGRVIECENGFRSEYAYPKELWLLEENLESLSWQYGVPIRKI